MYRRISAILPKSFIEWVKSELEFVGVNIDEKRFAGFLVSFGIALSFAVGLNLHVFLGIFLPIGFTATLIVFVGGALFWINSVAEKKGRLVELLLPDALQLIASNIKAGMTAERALMVSARPEFGPLAEEFKNASRSVLAGVPLGEALSQVSKKIKSKLLERTMWLLTQGIKSGGEIADLLLQIGADIRDENATKDEIQSNVSIYVMMIFIAAAFGSPLLFGMSSIVVGTLTEQMEKVDISPETLESMQKQSLVGNVIGVPTASITEDFVVFFSVVSLIVTSILASLTLGAIGSGNEKNGIKYIPLLMFLTLAVFFAVRIVVGDAIGSMSTMM